MIESHSTAQGRNPLAAAFNRAFRRSGFLRDTSGSVAMIAALAFPVLIGGMGLGAEVGYWYLTERKLQHAADLSAFSAGVQLNNRADQTRLDTTALYIAEQSGFVGSRGAIEVHTPPSSGPGVGDATQVEVVLTETLPRYFTSFFQTGSVAVRGRAVAGTKSTKICSLALSPTANSAFAVKGSETRNSRTAS
jgi:uncharacterized membrane protein